MTGGGLAEPPGPAARHRVIVVGDSIIDAAELALRDAIPGALVDGVGGRGPEVNFMSYRAPTLRQAVTTYAPQVAPGGFLVVQDDGGTVITAEFVRYVTDVLPDDRTLVWVGPSNWGAASLARSRAAVQSGIFAQASNIFVDWERAVAQDPGGLLSDGLHPSERGTLLLASLVKDATR